MTRLFDKRFLIVSGKGGTGKSTLCAALALATAARGQRVVVAELNVRPRIPAMFGVDSGGYAPIPVHEGIEAIRITPEESMREYGVLKLRFKRIYRFVFENETMRGLTGMLPGLKELLLLGKLHAMEGETVRRGQRPRWDTLIVDGPATGHCVSMFRLPAVILEAVSAGPLADDARRIQQLLQDETRTAFNIAAVPEEMAVQEATELSAKVTNVLKIHKGLALLNMIWPPGLASGDEALLDHLRRSVARHDPVLAGLLSAISESERRHRHQEPMVQRMRERVGLPVIELPFLFARELNLAEITHLSQRLDEKIERCESATRPGAPGCGYEERELQ